MLGVTYPFCSCYEYNGNTMNWDGSKWVDTTGNVGIEYVDPIWRLFDYTGSPLESEIIAFINGIDGCSGMEHISGLPNIYCCDPCSSSSS